MRGKRWLFLIAVYAVLVIGGWLGGRWLSEAVAFDVRPSNEARIHFMVMWTTLAYLVASAIPFVPGAEIGYALLIAFGTRLLLLVYGCMVGALLLSYCVGRFVPATVTAGVFDFLGLGRARELVLRMAPLDAAGRMALLTEGAPSRLVPFLLRHRYLALALLLNTPGNSLIGGGGGIALVAGMSGLFRLPAYVATVALAVAPLPLVILLTGYTPWAAA